MSPVNRSCVIINQTPHLPSMSRASVHDPLRTTSPNTKSSRTFRDPYNHPVQNTHPHSSVSSPNQNKNWYSTLDGSYPESDYLSLGSNPNNSQGQIPPYRGDRFAYNSNPNSANHPRSIPSSKNYGYYNPVYSENSLPYRTNSVRDDDETTTTSGSYTINHDDVDEDLQRQYPMSQVV